MKTFQVKTRKLKDVVDITQKLSSLIKGKDFRNGVCHVFVSHTTAALTTGEIGEGTEEDLLEVAEKFIPQIQFRHAHDPSHAWSHMASSLIGASVTVPVINGELRLGTWQSILLLELDGPRERQIVVALIPEVE